DLRAHRRRPGLPDRDAGPHDVPLVVQARRRGRRRRRDGHPVPVQRDAGGRLRHHLAARGPQVELMELGPLQKLVRLVALACGLLFTVIPVFWVISIAFRPPGALTFPVRLVPPGLTLVNFSNILFSARGIGITPYLNAAIYGLSSAFL